MSSNCLALRLGETVIAEVVVIELTAPGAGSIYSRVNRILGWDGAPGPEVRPEGLISSIAGESGDKLIVIEAWESREHQEKSMHSELGPALAEAKAVHPSRVEWFTGVIDFHLARSLRRLRLPRATAARRRPSRR